MQTGNMWGYTVEMQGLIDDLAKCDDKHIEKAQGILAQIMTSVQGIIAAVREGQELFR